MKKYDFRRTLTALIVGLIVLFGACRGEAFIFQDRVELSKSLAHYAMGHMYDLLGLTNRAVLEYEKAAQFDDTAYLIHLRLGTDYARLNMLSEAIERLQLAQKYNPEDMQSHYLLALIYSSQQEYDKAAQEYEHILTAFAQAEPENVQIYGYLGQLYYSQRKYDKAIAQFEKILSFEPKNADVMYLLGSLYLDVDRTDDAIKVLARSIEIDPGHDGSLNTLGYLYAEKSMKLDEAEDLINRALAIDPDNGAYLDSLAWVYYKKGDYEKALGFLKQADAQMKDPVIYDHMGDVYLKLHQTDKALEYWELSLGLLAGQKNIVDKINHIKGSQAQIRKDQASQ